MSSRKLPFAEPDPAGSERAKLSKAMRDLATEVSRLQPQARTAANGEENDHGPEYPVNFTKGLLHDDYGILKEPEDFINFVEAINSTDQTLFEKHVRSSVDHVKAPMLYNCVKKASGKKPVWRGWESPRSGHVYELQGPDSGALGMAPAPRVGSSELAVEMAEVYAMAILRDVPFSEIANGGNAKICDDDGTKTSVSTAKKLAEVIKGMDFFGDNPVSSTPHFATKGLNCFEKNRRDARGPITEANLFRGSTPGAQTGPYISQFMLIGTDSIAGAGGGMPSFPGKDSCFDMEDGFIPYGSLVIDQRTITHKGCVDYMTQWCPWLDVQNGANLKGCDLFEKKRRFITTPRDLATYVHFDALYEAYLNAGLIMLSMGVPTSKGFPEPSPSGRRDSFATFGGPHILSLVTEVATRCLKAVRRQKFNYHRRARPEVMGGRLTLTNLGFGAKLGCAEGAFKATLDELPLLIKSATNVHNKRQNKAVIDDMRNLACSDDCIPDDFTDFDDKNLLLAMAFPEGSPMHPAYGAGHATVAGGCVTMLKAFFEMFDDCNSGVERKLMSGGKPIIYEPKDDGSILKQVSGYSHPKNGKFLTIQGELDKLAANISIGRNMAGVHYYSDYYDSLRMGERVAVGILLEQAPTYGERIECSFKSFDGDLITISGEAGSCPTLTVMDKTGHPVPTRDWWLRHVTGEEFSEDLTV